QVRIAMAGQAPEICFQGIDRLDATCEAGVVEGLQQLAGRTCCNLMVVVHDDGALRHVPEANVSTRILGGSSRGVLRHRASVLIQPQRIVWTRRPRATTRDEFLCPRSSAFALLEPLQLVAADQARRLARPQRDDPGRPTKREPEIVQRIELACARAVGIAMNGNHANGVTPDHRLEAAYQFLVGQYRVEVGAVRRNAYMARQTGEARV